jgi:hypothetical protein
MSESGCVSPEVASFQARARHAGEWLETATTEMQDADWAARIADQALQQAEGTPGEDAAYIAGRAASARAHAARLVHGQASAECAEWQGMAIEREAKEARERGERDDWF